MGLPLRNRRTLQALGGGVLVLAACAVVLLLAANPRRPDIVLVVWDTCRGDRVTVNGYPHPTTPRLAGLASRGVTYRQAFAPSPWTPPAHASLFTGLLPRRHGLQEEVGARVHPGIPLLAETLAEAGYETVALIANPQISELTGLDDGFETAFKCYAADVHKATGDEVLRQAESWLTRRRARGAGGRPLFLFVNLMDSHLPYTFEAGAVAKARGDAHVNAARDALSKVQDKFANSFTFGLKKAEPGLLEGLDAGYDGSVHLTDRTTGALLDLLEKEGILPRALVAVVGDHGENLGEHGELNHLFSLYEPVLHVPLVLAWPGRFEGGRVEQAQVRIQDLYPTLLEAAGVEMPKPCGKDALSLRESPLRSRVLVAEYGPPASFVSEAKVSLPEAPEEAFRRFFLSLLAVREPSGTPGARKYIRFLHHPEKGEPVLDREELYDLAADPGELRNLLPSGSPEERARADRLKAVGLDGGGRPER